MDRFEDAKLRVKEANDLVALIESYLPLKPRGRLLVALCPFHADKSPSFTVYPDKQNYYCFGCGKSGDAFTFLMEREGLTFREAMETLADRGKISLEGVFGQRDSSQPRGPDPHQVLGEVQSFLQRMLHGDEGGAARAYLEQRGLSAAIEPWALGYHPDRPGALRQFAQERRLPTGILEQAGLLRGGREMFAGRVIFPIEDERGRVVAFGGRVLPGTAAAEPVGDYTPPKYLNSPESPFFHKRSVLFGLHRSKQAGARRLVVMEGYTDVIACHLAGFPGAVAALGTAFTGEHSKKIERYATDGVVLLFDGDRAGFLAAERAAREIVNSRLTVRMALMGEAKDPAELVAQRPGEDPELVTERRARFADLIEGADDWLATWFRLLRRRLDFAQAAQLETAARECATLLGHCDSELRRQALTAEMARHLAMPEATLQRLLKTMPRRPAAAADPSAAATAVPPPPKAPATPVVQAEQELLACLLADPLLLGQLADTNAAFESAAVTELVAMMRDAAALGRVTSAEAVRYLFTRCAERSDLRAVLAVAGHRAESIADPVAFLAVVQSGRQLRSGRGAARNLRLQLQQALSAGDRQTADELTQQLVAQMRQQRPRAAGT